MSKKCWVVTLKKKNTNIAAILRLCEEDPVHAISSITGIYRREKRLKQQYQHHSRSVSSYPIVSLNFVDVASGTCSLFIQGADRHVPENHNIY